MSSTMQMPIEQTVPGDRFISDRYQKKPCTYLRTQGENKAVRMDDGVAQRFGPKDIVQVIARGAKARS